MNSIIKKLNDIFGQDGPKLAETKGKIHDYLGMTIDWTAKRRVKFTMYDFLEDILIDAPPEFDGEDVTPATNRMFIVDENIPLLPFDKAEYFHSTTACFLYVGKRARPDIQVTVAFLCKRVLKPNESDWAKLKRLVRYICPTI